MLSGDVNILAGSITDFYSLYDNCVLAKNVCLGSLEVAVEYSVTPLYNVDKANKAGSTVPIKIQVTDTAGEKLSDAGLPVVAVSLSMSDTTIAPVPSPGNSRPGGAFTYDPTLGGDGGYQYNVKTTGLASGAWTLTFTIGDDPTEHATTFVVR